MKTLFLTIAIVLSNVLCFSQKDEMLRYSEDSVYSPTFSSEARTYYNKGVKATSNYRYKKAIKFYQKALQIDGKYTDAMDNMAICFRRTGQLDSAVHYYHKSLEILPNNMLALSNLGLVYTQKKEFENAINAYNTIIDIDSLNANAYYGLAQVYINKDELELTITNGLRAFKLWEDNNELYASDALYFVGFAYKLKDDKENAIKYFKKSTEFGNLYAQKELEYLLSIRD